MKSGLYRYEISLSEIGGVIVFSKVENKTLPKLSTIFHSFNKVVTPNRVAPFAYIHMMTLFHAYKGTK